MIVGSMFAFIGALFETLIIQPIFNIILFIYSIVPGNDFGVAIILFTILVRFAMWPTLKKSLHQSRIMKKIQPKIKEIRRKNKGDKQTEAAQLMELYKEEGVSPFGTMGLLLIQMPVMFGLFAALRALIYSPIRIIELPYSFIRSSESVQHIIDGVAGKTNEAATQLNIPSYQDSVLAQVDPEGTLSEAARESVVAEMNISHQAIVDNYGVPISSDTLQTLNHDQLTQLYTQDLVINNEVYLEAGGSSTELVQGPFFEQFLGSFVDLSKTAIGSEEIYIPLVIVAAVAGIAQYFVGKQLRPKTDKASKKGLRSILKDAKDGKDPEQSEINAAVGGNMAVLFAPLIAYISLISPGGLALYFATSGVVGYLQQRFLLEQDVEEMEEMADKAEKSNRKKVKSKVVKKKDSPAKKNKSNQSRAQRKKNKE